MHVGGAYLVENNANNKAGGYYFLSNFVKKIALVDLKLNGPVHTLCKILKNDVASTAEYEIAAVFENGQDATVMRRTLIEMDHQQPPIPIQIDNIAENSLIKRTLKQKQTKRMDMK